VKLFIYLFFVFFFLNFNLCGFLDCINLRGSLFSFKLGVSHAYVTCIWLEDPRALLCFSFKIIYIYIKF
jgi:hypothetical protein